jgi:TatD DNase family protein
MLLIDSHCHLDAAHFSSDFSEVLYRGLQQKLVAFVVPATDFAAWPRLRELSILYPQIKPAFGLHPTFLHAHHEQHLHALRHWLQYPECVAIGECGLDFFLPDLAIKQQEYLFIEQIKLAKQYNKPLIIHARKATERVIQLLRCYGPVRGVIHSYSGSLEQARLLIDLGVYLGIAGAVTYPRSHRIRALVQVIPLEFLLLETDAPDQPLFGEQGRRNEPSHLPKIAQAVADLKKLPMTLIAEHTTQNALRLFGPLF